MEHVRRLKFVFIVFIVFIGLVSFSGKANEEPAYLAVQFADRGSLVSTGENTYTLTLENVFWTYCLKDSPELEVGKLSSGIFLEMVNFLSTPVGAVIELFDGPEDADLITVRLKEAVYDPQKGTVQYKAEIIPYDHEDVPTYIKRHAITQLAERVDAGLPETFSLVLVYIHLKEPIEIETYPSPMAFKDDETFANVIPTTWVKPKSHDLPTMCASLGEAPTGHSRCREIKVFDVSVKFAEIEGTACIRGQQAYVEVEFKLFGKHVASCRIDPDNLKVCPVNRLIVKLCVVYKLIHRKIYFEPCFLTGLHYTCVKVLALKW